MSLLFYYIEALGNWKDIKEFANADDEDDEIIGKCVCQTDQDAEVQKLFEHEEESNNLMSYIQHPNQSYKHTSQ